MSKPKDFFTDILKDVREDAIKRADRNIATMEGSEHTFHLIGWAIKQFGPKLTDEQKDHIRKTYVKTAEENLRSALIALSA